MDNVEKLSAICSERVNALTMQETEVFDNLLDHLDHLPERFLRALWKKRERAFNV